MSWHRRSVNKTINNVDDSGDVTDESLSKTQLSTTNIKQNMHYKLRQKKRCVQLLTRGFVLVLIVVYVLVPLIIYFFPSVQGAIIFLHFVRRPRDLTQPQSFHLEATRNFYIKYEQEEIELGTWHVLPKSFIKESVSDSHFEELLKNGPPIVIYLHGNAGSRASGHRIELYKVLRDLDMHVIAADYRGYGDSTAIYPSEDGMIKDAQTIYNWVKKRAGKSRIFVWGHSLGTGVGTRAVCELNKKGELPSGLVLEAPFNNMSEELLNHPFSFIFTLVPWFKWAALSALRENNALFQSDKHISGVTIPILILHAEDDVIIPIRLGRQLYEAALTSRSAPVSFIQFDYKHGYNHQHICRAADLPQIIRQFVDHPEEKLPPK